MHPRDRYITLFGRKPVYEALMDSELVFGRLLIARSAKGPLVQKIEKAARRREVSVERCDTKYVNRISKNGRQDQGVALDVIAPLMSTLGDWLDAKKTEDRCALVLLDRLSTPGNVGLIIRSAAAFGMSGVILPRKGCPPVSPLVVKASAGTAFRVPILKTESTETALQTLQQAGFDILGLDASGDSIFQPTKYGHRTAWVLGNESDGLSKWSHDYASHLISIPMTNGVESLNVACAASVVFGELMRRRNTAVT